MVRRLVARYADHHQEVRRVPCRRENAATIGRTVARNLVVRILGKLLRHLWLEPDGWRVDEENLRLTLDENLVVVRPRASLDVKAVDVPFRRA